VSQTEPVAPRRTGWRGARRRIVLVVVGALVVGGSAALAGLWHVSASPQFCNSCHIMRPYVEAWKVSRHNTVACVQCHYPPGFRDTLWVKFQAMSQVAKWATQTYSSKPFAVVEDGSCFRSGCHSRSQLEGKGVVMTFGRGTRFDHRPHLDAAKTGRQLRCTSCHSQIVVEKHFEVATSTCFLCHFKGTKSGRELTPIAGCTGCHEPPKGEITVGSIKFNHGELVQRGVACQKCHLNVVEGGGEAPRERCFTCHNQPEKIDRYRDTALLHTVHVSTHTIECTRCHTEIKHKLPPPIGAPTAARQLDSGLLAMLRRQ
jgi:nitrate/TMAO reductase-like tetraheme cytochrome c subunit